MRRRTLLRASALLVIGSAGCLGREGSFTRPAPLDDPPERVYRPTATSGLRVVGTADAGSVRVALLYSYPVPFWEVVGRTTYRRAVEPEDEIHLMATAWEPETGTVFPEVGLTVELRRDGELVAEEAVYAMLSQRLGFHYGDNFALPGDDTYEVTVSVGGLQLRRTGRFEGRFDDPASTTFEFDYSRAERNEIDRRAVSNSGGHRPLEPVSVEGVPVARATTNLPGRRLGVAETSGAHLLAHELRGAAAGRFTETGSYLAVVAHTPYNELLLPSAGLRATVVRTGETVFEDVLTRTVDPVIGYHYGAAVPDLAEGDEIWFETLTPPQVARHAGYETAFVEMPPTSLRVS